MKKLFNYLISIIIFIWLLFCIFNSSSNNTILKETCYLWFSILVPSILPLFFISNLLFINNDIFIIPYKLTNWLFKFENITSCMLFYLSFLSSNPTTTTLIVEAVNNNQISHIEGNRLMRCTNHFSIIFIKVFCRSSHYFLIVSLSLYLASFLILFFSRNKEFDRKINDNISNNEKNDLFILFDKSYQLLLKILIIMIIINYCCFFIKNIYNSPFIDFCLNFLEITIGTRNFNNLIIDDFLFHFLFIILLSTGGFSLIVQILTVNKKTMQELNFLNYRIVHCFLSCIIYLLFIFL